MVLEESLMKTEVVLKLNLFVVPVRLKEFNENRSCIEIQVRY